MGEALLLVERVKNTISLGESHFREFKSAFEGKSENKKPRLTKAICQEIGEALVAFANADGGELIIGVEDDGTVTGVPHDGDSIKILLESPLTHVFPGQNLPILYQTKLTIDEKIILFFAVSKGTEQIYQLPDGRCMRRRDKQTLPEAVENIAFERNEKLSRSYDREFVEGATTADLDIELIHSLADSFLKGLSVEKYLQQLDLADYSSSGLRLKRAALLLFAKEISKWHPRSQVRILKIDGTEMLSGDKYNVISDEIVQDNIFRLVSKSWDALRPFLAYKTEFGEDARFTQRFLYPEFACREALINAIAHRDYIVQNGVDVFIFDDRMEIHSPGGLLSTVLVKDILELKGVHESRNSLIAKLLRENHFMRELGEGMKRIFEEMSENDLSVPAINSDSRKFSITLFHHSVYSPVELEWLNLFADYKLEKNQKRIIALGINNKLLSPRAIYKCMGTNDRDEYDRAVTGLRLNGILIEVRSNAEALAIARKTGREKQSVERFKVALPSPHQQNSNAIFISGLPSTITEQTLREYFEHLGSLRTGGKYGGVVLPRDRDTQKIRGFGFIYFEDVESAERALSNQPHLIEGKFIAVAKYKQNP
jgi:ATP-dependent DNA helicase RecG